MARISFAVPPPSTFFVRGFSLAEMAVVLVIVALLIGGMVLPLSVQRELKLFSETESILANAKEAVLGFAVVNERLPCPATANSAGREAFCSTKTYPCTGTEVYEYYDTAPTSTHEGYCFTYYAGLLPSVTLGMQPTDTGGYAVDSWANQATSRLRYAVSTNALRSHVTPNPPTSFVLTKFQGMKTAVVKPDLSVCNGGAQILYSGTMGSGLNQYAKCIAGNALIEDAAAIIYSLGKNASTGGVSANESPNVTADTALVSTEQSATFDDQLTWISPGLLINRMSVGGRL